MKNGFFGHDCQIIILRKINLSAISKASLYSGLKRKYVIVYILELFIDVVILVFLR